MEMSVTQRQPRRGNPILNFFSSIWLGITLIVLIFAYGALGSAVPGSRQIFELTEFQYFNHWIFTALIVLFCINLIVATIRRIKFNLINAGVLTVHTGLLLLCGSSIWYFGSKIEGDVLMAPATIGVYSKNRAASGDMASAQLGKKLIAARGQVWEQNIPMMGGLHRVEVVEVSRLGLDTAEKVTLEITAPNQPVTRVELPRSDTEFANYYNMSPQLLIHMSDAEPVTEFYDNTTPSLTLLLEANNDIVERDFNLPSLPYYNERFVAVSDDDGMIEDTNGGPVESKRTSPLPMVEFWRMPVPLLNKEDALAEDLGFTMEIDGYLPYAEMDSRPVEGGDQLNPLAQIAVGHNGHLHDEYLLGQVPSRQRFDAEDGTRIVFNWIGDGTEPEPEWMRRLPGGNHILEVEVRDKGISRTYDVSEGDEIQVEGTDYKLKIEQLRPNWPLRTQGLEGATTSIALVWVESGDNAFQRSVMDRFPHLNQDRDRAGAKIRSDGDLVDENLVIRYTDAASHHVRLVAGNNFSPTIIHTLPGGGAGDEAGQGG